MRRLPALCWPAALAFAVLATAGRPAFAGVTLQVTAMEGSISGRDLDFGTVRSLAAGGQSQTRTVVRRVRLTITTTSSGPYRVFQEINGPWRSLSGVSFPLERVLLSVTESAPKGEVQVPRPAPVRPGRQELYRSSNSGQDTELVLTYTVQVPEGQQAGGYRAPVTYRVVSQ